MVREVGRGPPGPEVEGAGHGGRRGRIGGTALGGGRLCGCVDQGQRPEPFDGLCPGPGFSGGGEVGVRGL